MFEICFFLFANIRKSLLIYANAPQTKKAPQRTPFSVLIMNVVFI
jgi:hypothetical protein